MVEKEGELHPSWRRWARPASPHMTSPDASQIQEVAREDGERMEGPEEHWKLPQLGRIGGQLPAGCGGPSLLRRDDGDADQELVARFEHLMLKLKVEMVESEA